MKARVLLLALSCLWAATGVAQDTGALGERFFSVTITRNETPLLMPIIFPDTQDNLIVKGAPLIDVIRRAYGLERYQVIDGPEWIQTPRLYDIEAVPPPAALVASDEAVMLKALLVDRFNLQAELFMGDVSIWVLADDERGDTKLEALEVDEEFAAILRRNSTGIFSRRGGGPVVGGIPTVRFATNMNGLVMQLAQRIGQPVLNRTRLTGLYFMDVPLNVSDTPTLTAWLDEMGLVFELRTLPMEQLRITYVDHPQLDAIDR